MRRLHFETLKPVCPLCRSSGLTDAPLVLAHIDRERDDIVLEGTLHCSAASCRSEYPILDGIPLLVPNLRAYVSTNFGQLMARDDLSETTESLIGDAAGPGTPFDATRQYLSTYAWDHFADLDPATPLSNASSDGTAPGAVVRCLEAGLKLLGGDLEPPVLDVGCSVGRGTFALAERSRGLVLGLDANFAMLRIAGRILGSGVARYPLRRVGVVYDRREFDVRFHETDNVDFWMCDAMALPFAADSFGLAVGLNVLDCVPGPRQFLENLRGVLRTGGRALLSTPYDWSPATTPIEGWIGGHSQRGDDAGAAEPVLRSLLSPGTHPQSVAGLRVTGEITNFPWHTRVHDRSLMHYAVHLVAAEATA